MELFNQMRVVRGEDTRFITVAPTFPPALPSPASKKFKAEGSAKSDSQEASDECANYPDQSVSPPPLMPLQSKSNDISDLAETDPKSASLKPNQKPTVATPILLNRLLDDKMSVITISKEVLGGLGAACVSPVAGGEVAVNSAVDNVASKPDAGQTQRVVSSADKPLDDVETSQAVRKYLFILTTSSLPYIILFFKL